METEKNPSAQGGTGTEGGSASPAACAAVLGAAVTWGMLGIWSRGLMAAGLSSGTITGVRNFGGMLLMTLLFLLTDRTAFHVEKRHLKYFPAIGICSVVMYTICYLSCQRTCSLAVASVLLYTAPSFVVVLSALLWRTPVTGRKLLALGLTLAGCVLVCGVFAGDLTVTPVGFLFGIGSGFFYALYSILGRYALAHYGAGAVTLWTYFFAGPVSLLLAKPAELVTVLSRPDLLVLALGMAAVSTAAPSLLYTCGLSRLESGRASILASLEPVAAAVTGALVFGEPVGAATAAGIVCVLAGIGILR